MTTPTKEATESYAKMWEDFAEKKSKVYNETKFTPINRVGLTNYIREEAIIQQVLSVPHERILDIGCASGRQVFRLAPHCSSALGVDIAEGFVQEANEQKEVLCMHNADFAVADFDSLPSGPFDIALCCEVLEHVFELDAAIDAIDNAIKPGGHVLITVPHYNADGTWWGRILRLFKIRTFEEFTDFRMKTIEAHGNAHVREFSRAQLVSHFIKRGYSTKHLSTVSHLDGPWGDMIISGFLYRFAFLRPFFIALDHVGKLLFPGLGRHIVLLAQKPM